MKRTNKNQFNMLNAIYLIGFIFIALPVSMIIIESVPTELTFIFILILSLGIGYFISKIILVKQLDRPHDKWFYILVLFIFLFTLFMFISYYLGIII
ncbi:hypothetical protein HZY86_03185 [Aerococcaceae bacterium DSM 111020]|nr:hypothetical protein [Aerococcaceae bacterium DSM 111020]